MRENTSPKKIKTRGAELRQKFVALFLLLVLAIASGAAVWRAEYAVRPHLNQKEILTEDVSLFDISHVVIQGYSVTKNEYAVIEGERDPKLIFRNIDMPIRSIEIIFGRKLIEDAQLTIYYLDEDGNFSEDSTITVWGDYTTKDYIFNLPKTTTAILRIDINGDFNLEDIRVSSSPSVMVDQQEPPFSRKLLVMLIVMNFLIFAAIYHKRVATRNTAYAFHRAVKDAGSSNLWKGAAFLGLCIVVSLAAVQGASLVLHRTFYLQQKVLACSTVTSLGVLWLFRKHLARHPELGFFLLALLMGVLFLFYTPVSTYLTWDDEIHYQNVLALSYGGASYETPADLSLINRVYRPSYISESIDRAHAALLNTLYLQGAVRITELPNIMSIRNAGYLPAALGMIAGRVLHCSFSTTFTLGRIANLILYLLLGTLAIRKLKFGKMLAVLTALLPINLYQACNYTYDSWVFIWIFYGVCRFVGYLQDREKAFSLLECAVFVVCTALGSLSKPVYLPILILLFVVPGYKFPGRKSHAKYLAFLCAVVAIGAVGAIHLLPSIVSGLTDTRGGSDVNALWQLRYIQNNPLSAAKTILKFLFKDYLRLGDARKFLTYTGFFSTMDKLEDNYGSFPFADLWAVLLLYTAFTEGSKEELQEISASHEVILRLGMGFGSFLSVVLYATVMYLSFTGVGADTVAGCQGRYIEPVLLPGLWLFRGGRVQIERSREKYRVLIFLATFLLLVSGIAKIALAVHMP